MKNNYKKGKDDDTFPAMYHGILSNIIVLFTEEHKGTIIKTAGNSEVFPKLGYYSSLFGSCFDTNNWKRLNPGDIVEIIQ